MGSFTFSFLFQNSTRALFLGKYSINNMTTCNSKHRESFDVNLLSTQGTQADNCELLYGPLNFKSLDCIDHILGVKE